jgi:hypothetical protein
METAEEAPIGATVERVPALASLRGSNEKTERRQRRREERGSKRRDRDTERAPTGISI